MPHAEIKYSNNLGIDAAKILSDIEATILRHDDGSGECKGRAYPTSEFKHSHILVSVGLLRKPHRDEEFTKALIGDLENTVKNYLSQRCFFSLSLNYSSENYVTDEFVP